MKLLVGIITALALLFPATANSYFDTASWYGPGLYGNNLGCSQFGRLTPYTNGVAHKSMRCGTRLTVCYRSRCRATRVVDRGPYVRGRNFDLAAGLARSLRFGGVQRIRWWYGW